MAGEGGRRPGLDGQGQHELIRPASSVFFESPEYVLYLVGAEAMGCSQDYFPGEPAPVENAERTFADSEAESARRTLDRLKARHPAEWSEWQRVLPLLVPVYDFGADEPFGFSDFLKEVGRRPSSAHSVRRLDRSKPFEQGNMAWAERRFRRPKVKSPYLTAKQVAARLVCSLSNVYRMVEAGRLQAFSMTGGDRTGKRGRKGLRILAKSVDEWVINGVSEPKTVNKKPAVTAPPCPPRVKTKSRRPTPSWEVLPLPR